MSIFHHDSIVSKFFNTIGDIILLNILFIVFSIPVFTIGASLTALYYCCMKIIKDDELNIKKEFLKSFKENFKQSTIVWIIVLVLATILLLNIQFLHNINTSYAIVFKYLSYFVMLLLTLESLYIFPTIAAFKNNTRNLLKNSFIFTYMHFPTTIIIVFIWLIPISLTLTDFKLLPLYIFIWFTFGFSILTLTTSFFLYRVFKKQL